MDGGPCQLFLSCRETSRSDLVTTIRGGSQDSTQELLSQPGGAMRSATGQAEQRPLTEAALTTVGKQPRFHSPLSRTGATTNRRRRTDGPAVVAVGPP